MRADLVLEGGGVKGIGFVGAIESLRGAGYEIERIAGTSAGAVVGALVAAGASDDRLQRLIGQTDYTRFADPGLLDRFGPVGIGLSVLFEQGIYEGDGLRSWLRDELAALGVETFGDLRRDDPDSCLPPDHRHRLVVMAADVSRGRLVRLPWDYEDYGLDGDEQSVADAVFASSAIPILYEPVVLSHIDGERSYLVDGGLLSNFPIDTFDRTDGRPPRWPTIGIKLSARPETPLRIRHRVTGTLSYVRAVLSTAITAHDQRHLDDPCVVDRTIFVDTTGVDPIDFSIDTAERARMHASGVAAAQAWLSTWDHAAYLARCPAAAAPSGG